MAGKKKAVKPVSGQAGARRGTASPPASRSGKSDVPAASTPAKGGTSVSSEQGGCGDGGDDDDDGEEDDDHKSDPNQKPDETDEDEDEEEEEGDEGGHEEEEEEGDDDIEVRLTMSAMQLSRPLSTRSWCIADAYCQIYPSPEEAEGWRRQ